jgi:hypothetical protein
MDSLSLGVNIGLGVRVYDLLQSKYSKKWGEIQEFLKIIFNTIKKI